VPFRSGHEDERDLDAAHDSNADGETCQKWGAARQIRSVSVIPGAVPAADPSPPRRLRDVADLPTRELLEAVVDSGYTGHPWDELARRLVARALPDLEQSIRTGTIYHRCRRARLGIPQRQVLRRRPLAQDIAAEAVEDCLERFKDQVVPAGEWDPDRGTTLEDFFAACCVPHVANRWRCHLRQLPPHTIELDALDEPGQVGVLALVAGSPSDPVAVIELRDLLTRTLAPMNSDDQMSFVLRERGWSPAEIAQMLGIDRNTLDVRISRARKAARARRTR
jgi:RNA polymerase sigma factor (sigma-70 family)